jgi:hypothetical protein
MRDQADAGGPEARILRRAGDLLAEFRAELAPDGRDIDPDLLEDAAAHGRHHAAAATGTVPGLAREAPRRQPGMGAVRQLVLDLLESVADAVAQGFEPVPRGGAAGL